jgi:hypothetical protein
MTRTQPMGLVKFAKALALPAGCVVALLSVTLWTSSAHAYKWYDNGSGSGCVQCHIEFQGGSGALHRQHRDYFGVTSCNLCHPSGAGSSPVLTYWSGPGGGFGCAGCHGQDYGEISPNSGQPKSSAYGLRQFHVNKGVDSCGTSGCHKPGSLGHSDPFPPLFGEDVAPRYYDPLFSNLTNPCSSAQESIPFDGNNTGLDNDGDGLVDSADSDCASVVTTSTLPPATTTTLPFAGCGPTPANGCIASEKGVLLVSEKTASKEKLKISLKKLLPTVTQSQFGNPISGTTIYKICVYDSSNQLSGEYTVARAGDLCDGLSCWSAVKDTGYKYTDKSAAADGILKMTLSGGDQGKGKVSVIGKNGTGKMPLGVAAALTGDTSVTVQLLTSDAACFGLTLADVKKADGLVFKAVGQ